MSHVGISMQGNPSDPGNEPRSPRGRGFVAGLVALLLIVGLGAGLYFGGRWALDQVRGEPPADFPGPGVGSVIVVVNPGDSVTAIGNTLYRANVVASAQAFVNATRGDERANTISPGAYDLREQMSAAGAFEALLDPESRHQAVVVLPEGLRIDQTVTRTADVTQIPPDDLWAVLLNPAALTLPEWAPATGERRAEGFLFPATYEFPKDVTAEQALAAYVDRFNTAAIETNLNNSEQMVGKTPYEVLIIASLLQAEGIPQDFTKIARVIYNRLDPATWGGTYGYLQLDATLNYGLGQSNLNLTMEQLRTDGPYNTYTRQGLPPTPINSPGEEAIIAAMNPADGPWLWYVTVNPDTGETKFTDNFDEFLVYKEEFQTWCRQNSDRC